ncbi:MAG TPA: hypothetical protein VEA58_08170 [Anaerovoracaceae bacterium]|nr:hypothetical protein [Anaerovoracaceae bacterium]
MKGFLKMSGRDRNLLILLLAAIIFYLCYTYVIVPFMAETELLQMELESVEAELVRAEELSGKEAEMKKQESALKDDIIEKYAIFLTDIKQSRILYKVDTLATGTGLPISSYVPALDVISPVMVETGFYVPQDYPLKDLAFEINPELREDSVKEEASGGEPAAPQTANASEDMIPSTDVTLGFGTTNYESVYNFVGEVEKLNRTAVLKSIGLSVGDGGVQGQLVFTFYSLPRFDQDQKDGFDFIPVIPPGKANPFN